MRKRRKRFKLDGRKRVLRYEIQGRKYQRLIIDLDCYQSLVTCGFVNCGAWFFSFYLRTKQGLVYPRREFRFKSVVTPASFNKIHVPEFLPF